MNTILFIHYTAYSRSIRIVCGEEGSYVMTNINKWTMSMGLTKFYKKIRHVTKFSHYFYIIYILQVQNWFCHHYNFETREAQLCLFQTWLYNRDVDPWKMSWLLFKPLFDLSLHSESLFTCETFCCGPAINCGQLCL